MEIIGAAGPDRLGGFVICDSLPWSAATLLSRGVPPLGTHGTCPATASCSAGLFFDCGRAAGPLAKCRHGQA
jgi:hypothetical protein